MRNNVRNSQKVLQKGNIVLLKIFKVSVSQSFKKSPGTKLYLKIADANQSFLVNDIWSMDSPVQFELKAEASADIIFSLCSKSILTGTTVFGFFPLQICDFEDQKVLKPIVADNEILGTVEFKATMIAENWMSTQSTCNSLDMKDDFIKDSTNLDLDFFKPSCFKTHCQNTSEEFDSEENMQKFIQKVQAKKKKILKQQQEIFEQSEKLEKKSKMIQMQRIKNLEEAEAVKQERTGLDSMIETMNKSFYQLRSDKLKRMAHLKLIEKNKIRVSENLKRIQNQKDLVSLRRSVDSRNKENLDYSVPLLSEVVSPVINSESPVPDA